MEVRAQWLGEATPFNLLVFFPVSYNSSMQLMQYCVYESNATIFVYYVRLVLCNELMVLALQIKREDESSESLLRCQPLATIAYTDMYSASTECTGV